MTDNFIFFLGGQDLEMVTIRELLARHIPPERIHDKRLSWGARASEYATEIRAAIERGSTPVLIELTGDFDTGHSPVIIVDHHGERAGADAQTPLQQIFGLLGLPREGWTRWYDLVSANDRGWIPELRAMGATPEEIERVRRADRAAQGVTEDEERQAEEAVGRARTYGDLIVVRIPHARSSAVVDRLAFTGAALENVLVISPGEVNFSGAGDAVRHLNRCFPGGWLGGSLPARGFWGAAGVDAGLVLDEIQRALNGPGKPFEDDQGGPS